MPRKSKIQIRGGTAAEWTAADPILADREVGLETDTRKAKIGDGVTAWSGLSYAFPSGGGTVTSVTGTPPIASSGGTTPAISVATFDGTNPGVVPAGPADATKYLDGSGAFTTPAGGGTVTAVTATPPATSSGGTTPNIAVPAFVASGASHAAGLVPDPGVTGGTTKFLREDASFQVPPGTGVSSISVTAPMTTTGGTTPTLAVPAFVASGASHAAGLVPDPGASGGTTKFLREDATFQVPSGGSGNITSTGAAGSEPGSPSSGDLYLPNNGYVLERYSGAIWGPWGPLYPLTPPPANTSAIAADTLNGNITNVATTLTVTTGTPPSTPFTVIIGTEQIKVTTASGTNWSVIVRGYNGTTGASHTSGDTVTYENWEWRNQGTAAATGLANNGIFLTAPAASGANIRARKRLMGSNTIVSAAFLPMLANTTSELTSCGLFLRESGTGKIVVYQIVQGANGPVVYIGRGTSETSSRTNSLSSMEYVTGGPIFFQMQPTLTTMLFLMSGDGQNWIQVSSLAKATGFTTAPDEWGFYCETQSTFAANGMTLISWLEA